MSQADTKAPTPADKRPKSWRDDPLSVFLVASAILLGGMYGYDRWQTSRLEDQIARAEQIATSFAVDGASCGVSSAGLKGEVLVVHCQGLAADKVAVMAKSVDTLEKLDTFQKVVLRGADKQLVCPAEPAQWPDGCDEQNLPAVQ